jgi:hypothetical protein
MLRVLLSFIPIQCSSANLMNKMPTDLLPVMFTYMTFNDLLEFNHTFPTLSDAIQPIFNLSMLCGINGADVWPKLKVNLEHAESFDGACLGHIKRWNVIFPAISIIATPDFDENAANVIDLSSSSVEVELIIQTFVSGIDLKILLGKLQGKKLVSIVFNKTYIQDSALTMLKTDLDNFNIKKIAFIKPILSKAVDPLAILFSLISNFHSLTSFSIIRPYAATTYDWLALPDIEYRFDNSKLARFEVTDVIMPPLILQNLVEALPRSLQSINLKEADKHVNPATFVDALLKQKYLLTELVLENFQAGFDKLSAVAIARQVSSGMLKRLSLADSKVSDFAFTKLANALPSSRLTSLDLSESSAHESPTELAMLFRSIPLTPTLLHLNLHLCRLQAHTCQTLARNLGHLRELTLTMNEIGPSGARALARHFSTSSLKLLDLRGNYPFIYDADVVGRVNANGEVIKVLTDGDAPRGLIDNASLTLNTDI